MNRPFQILPILAAASLLGGCVLPGPALQLAGQQEELERQLAGTPVKVIRKGDALILRMPSDVTFAVDRAEVAPAFYPVLAGMASTIAKYSDTRVEVTGHADSTGTEAHNQGLSERRAASVGAVLASQGVGRARLVLSGRGEDSPIASNDIEEGRAANRRVEVVLEPIRPSTGALALSEPLPQPLF